MNFVKSRLIIGFGCRTQNIFYFVLTLSLSLFLINGCGDKVLLPSVEQLIEFENATLPHPVVDLDHLLKAKIGGGPYRVLPGDVLELTMPYILQVVVTDESVGVDKNSVYVCRVSDDGTITLPIVGRIDVAEKTLARIESAIIDAYYPKYALTVPSVFARVQEYETAKVSINGAVKNPGIYSLRSDQMSLIALIMEAGGIIDEGAASIRIIRSKDAVKPNHRNIPSNLTDKEIGQVTKSVDTELNESSPFYVDTKIQLSFRQRSAQSTTGILSISYNEKVLLSEQVNITSEIERLVLLKQLSWREPGISTSEVERKLCALAESLKPGSGSSIIESNISNEYVVSLMDIDGGQSSREENVASGPKVFPALGTQQTRTTPGLYKPSYGASFDTNKENNTDSNVGFHTDNTKSNTTTYVAINEELNEILAMVTEQKDGVKDTANESQDQESIILPVKGYNIPFADVVLKDGDNVIVERLAQPLFSVIGLVSKPGNFQYPPNVQYNLMQALAFAGGLDPTAEPRYATVYRLKPDGSIIHAAFKIIKTGNSSQLTDALNIPIKPGDIVSVEHTPRTRTNVFLDRIFRINLGTYFSLNDAWNN